MVQGRRNGGTTGHIGLNVNLGTRTGLQQNAESQRAALKTHGRAPCARMQRLTKTHPEHLGHARRDKQEGTGTREEG